MRNVLRLMLPMLMLAQLAACTRAAPPAATTATASATETLSFIAKKGTPPVSLSKQQLEAKIPSQTLVVFDPYYQRQKRFRALPLRAVLAAGFGTLDLSHVELVLRALDGYEVPIKAERLLDGSAYLAVADLDNPEWDPIGERAANPAPFYLTWKGAERLDLTTHPRPWALHQIEVARFEDLYPHTLPPVDAPEAARAGFALFRRECIRCHAINREGGRIGPDLNVPRSIVEYRPVEQIRAYIRDPLSFRYSAMPAHPQLGDVDLDALIAYFRVMSTHKHDRDSAAKPASAPIPDGGSHGR